MSRSIASATATAAALATLPATVRPAYQAPAFWQRGLAAPFDALRHARAALVRAGWLRASMLADRAFERWLGQLERLTLGPWARRV